MGARSVLVTILVCLATIDPLAGALLHALFDLADPLFNLAAGDQAVPPRLFSFLQAALERAPFSIQPGFS